MPGRGASRSGCPGDVLASPLVVPARQPVYADNDDRVVRARSRIAGAQEVARRGRYASAERMLRDALGVLERRQRFAGAARAAATLSEILRVRGQRDRAGEAMKQAKLLFDAVGGEGRVGAGSRLDGAEHEDYLEARTLLDSSSREECGVQRHRPSGGPSLEEVTSDCVSLCRSSVPSDETGALESICRWLWKRTGARAVAVYGFAEQTALLASAGDVGRRVHETILRLANDGLVVPLEECGREYRTVVPVHVGGRVVGALTIRWPRAPTSLEWVCGVARVASALCESEVDERVQLLGDRDVAQKGSLLLGRSPEMLAVHELIRHAATAFYPILIEGENAP